MVPLPCIVLASRKGYMSKINIYLARHGETLFNKKNYIQGHSDAPLTHEGTLGAVNLGHAVSHIPFDLAISSHLTRAITTKDLILEMNRDQSIPSEIDPMFAELDFGEYEGDSGHLFWEKMGEKLNLDFVEIGKRSLFEKYSYLNHPIDNPTAEPADAFKKRITKAVDNLVKRAQDENLEHILVVSHGIVVNGLVEIYDPNHEFEDFILNASVTKVVYEKGAYHIEYIGKRENL